MLDLHLRAAPTSVRDNPAFKGYYDSYTRSSPVKREAQTSASAGATDAEPKEKEKKPAKRRQTNVGTVAESAGEAASKAKDKGTEVASKAKDKGTEVASRAKDKSAESASRTPKSLQKLASRMPLPSSPQAVTSMIERQSRAFGKQVDGMLNRSGIPDATASTREMLSSVHAVTTILLLLEAVALNGTLIPSRHAFDLPLPFLNALTGGAPAKLDVRFPDLFVLLTADFWAPTLLWLTISTLIPAVSGWMVNLTQAHGVSRKHQYAVDPVVFNVVKGVMAWLVFVRRWQIGGLVDPKVAGTVDGCIWGGVWGMIVASGAGAFAGVWEGVLKK